MHFLKKYRGYMFLFVCMIKLTKIEPWAIGLRVANLLKLQLTIHICKNNSAKSLLQLAIHICKNNSAKSLQQLARTN